MPKLTKPKPKVGAWEVLTTFSVLDWAALLLMIVGFVGIMSRLW